MGRNHKDLDTQFWVRMAHFGVNINDSDSGGHVDLQKTGHDDLALVKEFWKISLKKKSWVRGQVMIGGANNQRNQVGLT